MALVVRIDFCASYYLTSLNGLYLADSSYLAIWPTEIRLLLLWLGFNMWEMKTGGDS
jgi:hypothetical protein